MYTRAANALKLLRMTSYKVIKLIMYTYMAAPERLLNEFAFNYRGEQV